MFKINMYFWINILFYYLKFYNNKDIIAERRNYIETIIMEKNHHLLFKNREDKGESNFHSNIRK